MKLTICQWNEAKGHHSIYYSKKNSSGSKNGGKNSESENINGNFTVFHRYLYNKKDLLYRYLWHIVISELNKTIISLVKLPFVFHSRYISRHFVVDVIWRLPVWNVKSRRYLVSCTLKFGSNLTKIIFQGKHFKCFIVVGFLKRSTLYTEY